MSLKNDKKSSCTIFSSDFRGSNFRENLTDSEREKKVKKAEEAVGVGSIQGNLSEKTCLMTHEYLTHKPNSMAY